MCLKIIDIDYKAKFADDYFDSTKYIKETDEKEDSTSKIEDIVYPMYVPVDTKPRNRTKPTVWTADTGFTCTTCGNDSYTCDTV